MLVQPMMHPWKSLSVFFPIYNEAEALPGVVSSALVVLNKLTLEEYELIIVDDGSTDGSSNIADQIALINDRVRVVHHKRNLGYGAALRTGFKEARFDWIAYTDGDGQFDFDEIRRFMEPSTRVDVVLGYRLKRSDHIGRRLNARGWSLLIQFILGMKVKDIDCGFKVCRSTTLHEIGRLQSSGAVISAEILLKLRDKGIIWEEVSLTHFPRQGGAPSGAKIGVVMKAVNELIKLRHNHD
jgi:glycosyltransferase involved in cell wall biosynthesis